MRELIAYMQSQYGCVNEASKSLPVVHEGNGICDSKTSWDPCILKKLNPLRGGLKE